MTKLEFVNILGYTAGAVTSLTFIPQVVKTWKSKAADEISLMMFVIAAVNEVMWIAYGILLEPFNWVIVLTNSILLVMSLTMIYFKFRYGNRSKGS